MRVTYPVNLPVY